MGHDGDHVFNFIILHARAIEGSCEWPLLVGNHEHYQPRFSIGEQQLHKHELQLSDYNISFFRPNVQISGSKKYIFTIFANELFQGQNEKLKIIPEIHIFGTKYFYIL